MMYRYTAEEIEAMREESRAAKCTAPALWWNTPAANLRSVCNGVGAEDSAKWIRDELTWLYRRMSAAAAIHDTRYEESDGTADNRSDADRELYDNAIRLLNRRYGVWRWLRPAYRHDRRMAYAAYVALVICGDAAWQAAYKRRLAREEAGCD